MTEHTPWTVKWKKADIADGGVVALVDARGEDIAYFEAKQNRWRSSREGIRFIGIARLVNSHVELLEALEDVD